MVHARRLFGTFLVLALALVTLPRASAITFTQSGTLANDDSTATFAFSTSTAQNFTFYTTSYSGGSNANGTSTAAGGFDPVLSLFNSNGTLFNGTGPSVTNGGSDAFLSQLLTPGSYDLVLSEFPNFSSNGLISGFTTGNLAFISSVCGTSTAFVDSATDPCTQKTNSYTVNIASSAVTPEPPSALLVLLPLAGVVVLNRRKLLPGVSF